LEEMMRFKRSALLVIIVFAWLATFSARNTVGAADGDNRAAVVVDYGDGRVESRCVSFTEDSISGHEALLRVGLPVEIDQQTGGAAICSIDSQGCPADDCFCACPGGSDCEYWSYWVHDEGGWHYAAFGAGLHQLHDGEMSGWVWGRSSVTQATPPSPVSFGDVCSDASLPTIVSTPEIAMSDASRDESGMVLHSAGVAASEADQVEQRKESANSWVGFAGLLLILVVLALIIHRRRRRLISGRS